MSLYIAVYCDSPHCAAPNQGCHEIELPGNLEDCAPTLQEMEARTVEVLQGLDWKVTRVKGGREHVCPECAKEEP